MPGPEQHRVGVLRRVGQPVRAPRRDPAVLAFVEAEHQRLRHRDAELRRDAAAGGELQLAGAGAQRRRRRRAARARHLHAAAHDQHARRARPCRPSSGPGSGMRRSSVRRDRRAHRAATGASGSAVTGAPSRPAAARRSCSGAAPGRRSGPAWGSKPYSVTPQFATSPSRSIARICVLGHALEQVAQAEHDDLVRRRSARARPPWCRLTVSSTLRSRRITSHQLSPPGGRW